MRLFIGLQVPDSLRQQIQNAWSRVNTWTAEARPIDPGHWHFTLAFLGEVSPENIEALNILIEKAVERSPKGSFSFTHFETFPSKNPSYVVARAFASPATEWNAYIERLRDLVSVAAPDVDRKPWIPHVSISRVKKNSSLPVWSEPIEPFEWVPGELTLVKSEISAQGSQYTDLHVFPLNL